MYYIFLLTETNFKSSAACVAYIMLNSSIQLHVVKIKNSVTFFLPESMQAQAQAYTEAFIDEAFRESV